MTLTQVNKFGLSIRDSSTIENIFKKYPEITEVTIFGSRAKGNYKFGSDIDLAIMNKDIDMELVAKLKNDFSESSLPYLVDLVIFDEIVIPEFTNHIKRIGIPFYEKNNASR